MLISRSRYVQMEILYKTIVLRQMECEEVNMNLSFMAIEICREKFGKGELCGFEQSKKPDIDSISEEDAVRVFDELLQSEMVTLDNDDIHISALGHHIMNMMIEPEVLIMLENLCLHLQINIYIRNAYYLCVVEEKHTEADGESGRLSVDLLPGFKQVIGAFVYALYREDKMESQENFDIKRPEHDIRIIGRAWDKDRRISSEMTVYGNYHNNSIRCHLVEEMDGMEHKVEDVEYEVSVLVNRLTSWMFDKVSVIVAREEDTYGVREY